MQKDPAQVSRYLKSAPKYHAGQVAPRTVLNAQIQLSDEKQGKNREVCCITGQGRDILNIGPFDGAGAQCANDVRAIGGS